MSLIIAVGFDGTIADHVFPDIGDPVPGAFKSLREFQEAGVKLILWTMRSGPVLTQAVEFCRKHGENPNQTPWTQSPKSYAHVYIDDAAFGCPELIENKRCGGRPMVDWSIVGPKILEKAFEVKGETV